MKKRFFVGLVFMLAMASAPMGFLLAQAENTSTTNEAVYHLQHVSTGERYYTMDENKKDELAANGWEFKGIEWDTGLIGV
jgi:hypothetical protein